MTDENNKPSWMNIPDQPAASVGSDPLPPPGGIPAAATPTTRADQRRRRNRLAAIAGGVVVLGATIAVVLAAAGSRSGTLVMVSGPPGSPTTVASSGGGLGGGGLGGGYGLVTTAVTGTDAQAFLSNFPSGSINSNSVSIGSNIAITSMSVTKNADGTYSGAGTVKFNNTIALTANLALTDKDNWTLTLTPGASSTYKFPSSGISVDPSTISGTVTMAAGKVTWQVSGTTMTWPLLDGGTLTTQFSIGRVCPFSDSAKCPTSSKLFLGLQSASLSIPNLPTVSLTGGAALDGSWARLEGTATASATFSVAGASVSMSGPKFTIWRGTRTDSSVAGLTMPDTSALTSGTNVEFCGDFAITIPSLVNNSTTGCVSWTPAGVVLGQVGSGPSMSLSAGSAPTGTSANVKGFGWTSLSTTDLLKIVVPGTKTLSAMKIGNVVTKLIPSTFSIGGQATLPGVVSSAIGLGGGGLTVDVSGQVTSNSISLQGTVPVSINFGNEPFKVNVQSLTLGLSAGAGKGLSMTLDTKSDVTLGYGSTARTVNSSIALVAATSPAVGFTLSLNAVGNPGGGDTMDGLTPSTRLAHPSSATFLVPDMFGIGGVNLWSLTGQIGFQDGSPSLAYSSTTYINPAGSVTKNIMKCTGACDDSDWLQSTLGLNVSYTNPCFAYTFTSNPNGGSLAIDGGVLTASSFQIGVSPSGCSITAGGTTLSLPPAFAGFAFTAGFGSTTLNVATQVSEDGFVFHESIDNLTLGGFTLNSMSLNISITSTASSVVFDALTTIKNFGAMGFHSDMGYNSSGMTWNVTGDICTDTTSNHQYCDPTQITGGLGSQTSGPSASEATRNSSGNTSESTTQSTGFKLIKLHFQQSGSVGSCATLDAAVDGVLKLSGTTYTLLGPNDGATLPDGTAFGGSRFKVDCNGIQSVGFGITFTHTSDYLKANTTATKTLLLSWSNNTLQGSYSVQMYRHADVDKSYCCGTYHFNQDVYFSIDVTVTISSTAASFGLTGIIDTGRVNGTLTFYLDSTGDFTGKVHLDVDVPWSDSTYHIDWDGL